MLVLDQHDRDRDATANERSARVCTRVRSAGGRRPCPRRRTRACRLPACLSRLTEGNEWVGLFFGWQERVRQAVALLPAIEADGLDVQRTKACFKGQGVTRWGRQHDVHTPAPGLLRLRHSQAKEHTTKWICNRVQRRTV